MVAHIFIISLTITVLSCSGENSTRNKLFKNSSTDIFRITDDSGSQDPDAPVPDTEMMDPNVEPSTDPEAGTTETPSTDPAQSADQGSSSQTGDQTAEVGTEPTKTSDDQETGEDPDVDYRSACPDLPANTKIIRLRGAHKTFEGVMATSLVIDTHGSESVIHVTLGSANTPIDRLCIIARGDQHTIQIDLKVPLKAVTVQERGNQNKVEIKTIEGANIDKVSYDMRGNQHSLSITGAGKVACDSANGRTIGHQSSYFCKP